MHGMKGMAWLLILTFVLAISDGAFAKSKPTKICHPEHPTWYADLNSDRCRIYRRDGSQITLEDIAKENEIRKTEGGKPISEQNMLRILTTESVLYWPETVTDYFMENVSTDTLSALMKTIYLKNKGQ